jgi:nucleoside-diphosphate-sugar epimerase
VTGKNVAEAQSQLLRFSASLNPLKKEKLKSMKITITGSLGNISKPLARELVQKGHSVTVISSKSEKQKDIEALGATAAIGSIEDVKFLTATFTGADAVYCMVPPANLFDHNLDLMADWRGIGNNYAQAIQRSGVKRVVHLSSIGGALEEDCYRNRPALMGKVKLTDFAKEFAAAFTHKGD